MCKKTPPSGTVNISPLHRSRSEVHCQEARSDVGSHRRAPTFLKLILEPPKGILLLRASAPPKSNPPTWDIIYFCGASSALDPNPPPPAPTLFHISAAFELTWFLAGIPTAFELTWFLADITTTFELTWFLADTIPYIGTEILNFHCFCIMEMFLFSKSMIAVPNSVKISRRIFLDRSQGLKCTNKLKNSLDPEACFS